MDWSSYPRKRYHLLKVLYKLFEISDAIDGVFKCVFTQFFWRRVRQFSHLVEEIWKQSFSSTVRTTVHTNPSGKRSFISTVRPTVHTTSSTSSSIVIGRYADGLLTKSEVKIAGYWQVLFLRVYGPRRSRSPQTRTRPISSHLDRTS